MELLEITADFLHVRSSSVLSGNSRERDAVSCLVSVLTRRGCCSLTHEGQEEVVEEGVNREREFTLHAVRKSLSGRRRKKQPGQKMTVWTQWIHCDTFLLTDIYSKTRHVWIRRSRMYFTNVFYFASFSLAPRNAVIFLFFLFLFFLLCRWSGRSMQRIVGGV